MGKDLCKICEKSGPNTDIVAIFTGMSTHTRGKDEHHFAHRVCLDDALNHQKGGGQLLDEIRRVVFHYEEGLDGRAWERRLQKDEEAFVMLRSNSA